MNRRKICPKCGNGRLSVVYREESSYFSSDAYAGLELFVDGDKIKEEFLQVDCICCGHKWLMKTDETVIREQKERLVDIMFCGMDQEVRRIKHELEDISGKR